MYIFHKRGNSVYYSELLAAQQSPFPVNLSETIPFFSSPAFRCAQEAKIIKVNKSRVWSLENSKGIKRSQ